MTEERKGILMVLAGGIAWGLSGVSGQYLMATGMDVLLLTCLRLIVSGVVLTALALLTQKERFYKAIRHPRFLSGTALFSFFGLMINQYAYLSAIHYTNAGTATVLQYVSPVVILGIICVKNRCWPTVVECVSMLLAISGTYLMATHGQFDQLSITPQGLFWGLLSAVTYALYILLPARLIREWGSLLVIGVGMLMSGLVVSVGIQVWNYDLALSADRLLALFGIIGVGTVFAYTIFLKGTTLIGPVKGSLLASIEPVASVVFGMVLMKDLFYVVDFFGMLLIMLAVLLISVKDVLSLKRQRMR